MNTKVPHIRIYLNLTITTLLAVGLIACGGDGGGSPAAPNAPVAPATPVAITSTNAPIVASAVVSGSTTFAGTSVPSTSPLVSPAASPMLGRFNANATKQAQNILSNPQFGPTFVRTTPCLVSGSETLDVADDGSSITVTYNNCSDTVGEVFNGTIALTNITRTPTVFSATSRIDLSVAVTGRPTVRYVGTYNFSTTNTSTGSTTTITGSSFSIIIGSNVTTLSNFSFAETYTTASDLYSITSNYTLASTVLGGSVTVTTVSPIQQYGYRIYPFAGQFVVTGANNTKIRVTILGDETNIGNDVRIEIDANGDNTYEITILRDWSDL